MKPEEWRAADVSRETHQRLEAYVQALLKWSKTINLVAKSTQADIWNRHILDSAQLYRHAPPEFRRWCDMGSGGGLPGIVVAILSKEQIPDASFTLIESDARKAAFLATISRELDLPVTVKRARLEEADPADADIVSARALAPLPLLLSYCHRHMSAGGIALLPKGRNHAQEVEAAQQSWHFDYATRPSQADPDSTILIVRDLRPLDI
ncbi:16S rRNA (guanine(527)-N(7))-methyltransferase RsmG [Pararhodobacter zhoushanensis]|uniref:16S rRNA (guanine(527)-N(7))-methyltransferase RsmG n=1 Tax=Pararhodobacter zhoushanensis TaxID=2479545 RepID=UPI000F8DE6D6|nr:16S rRNA (guanine(527)-N(7))-methyltransferase RsmG [Pararhodobacter zhoushanensis]